MKKTLIYLTGFLLLLASCKKDDLEQGCLLNENGNGETLNYIPVVMAHGFLASGDTYANQAMRFYSNDYPDNYIFAYDWNTLGGGGNDPLLLDAFIDQILAETGAEQVNLAGHSAGGGLSYSYLEDPERAAKVAAYVHIGSNAQNGPAGPEQDVPTLNIWSPDDLIVDSDNIEGATNVMIPGKDHFEIATCAEAFEAMFKFFHNGTAPKTTEIVPETTIKLSGKVLSLGENEARAGATVNIYEVEATTGFRKSASPNVTVTADAYGSWGPISVTKGANYEFETITNIPNDRVIYYYREGFQRSNPLVYLRTLPSGGFVSLLFNGIPESDDQSALTIFASNQGISAGRDDLFINDLELSNQTFCDPENNTIALFMYDGNENQTSDMTSQGLFGQFPFLSSADVFFPTSQQESIECVFNGRTLMVENKKSSDGIIIAVFE